MLVPVGQGLRHGLSAFAALALLVAGCSGGTITVPCDEARCSESCIAAGNESGSCSGADTCVCQRALELPPGPTSGLSSGGVVHRSSSGFQVELSIAPVASVAERGAGGADIELGLQPQTDPERRQE